MRSSYEADETGDDEYESQGVDEKSRGTASVERDDAERVRLHFEPVGRYVWSKGPAVSNSTLRQIKCGQTSKSWLLGVMGEPSRVVRTSANTEVLTYEYTKTIDSDFNFFIFFNADNRREERTVHVFEVENGTVTRHWRER